MYFATPPPLAALWCMAMVAAKYIGLSGQISSYGITVCVFGQMNGRYGVSLCSLLVPSPKHTTVNFSYSLCFPSEKPHWITNKSKMLFYFGETSDSRNGARTVNQVFNRLCEHTVLGPGVYRRWSSCVAQIRGCGGRGVEAPARSSARCAQVHVVTLRSV